jgi:hypothetical protein
VLLARSPGIAAGLRCVFAHPGGLHLPLVLRADGVQAEAAVRRSFPPRDPGPPRPAERDPWSGPRLTAGIDGEVRTADPGEQQSSGGSDAFDLQAAYWLGRLPSDGRVELTFSWPEAGLAENTVELRLDLGDLPGRIVRLG